MTHAELIAAMLDTARPVTKHYWTDLAHDARTIAAATCGDVFLWAPYESGSRLICLWRGDKPNARAKEIFDAMQCTGAPPQWYRVVIGFEDTSGLGPETADYMAAECRGIAETASIPGRASVSELHM